jgi:signal transduction histidine kinase
VSVALAIREPKVAPGRAIRPTDLLVAAVAFAGTLMLYLHGGLGGHEATARQLDGLGVVFAAAATLPLVAWRRAPLGVLAITIVPSATAMLVGYPGGPPIGPTIALYLLARSRDELHPWTRWTTAAVVGLFALHFVAYAIGNGKLPLTELAFGSVLWAAAWFAGDRMRLRRAEIAELEARASMAEQAAARERQLAAAEERARIARDLHDSAGHAINVIAVHAGAARLLHDRDPDGARDALETIERVAQQTVGEIDQIVSGLRDEVTRGVEVEAPPGLAALDALVAQHAGAGARVEVRRRGGPRRLVGAVDQAAYRILQEALTNAARHGAGSATVDLRFGSCAFELTVTNPVPAGAEHANGGGHGLVGMRERATMLAGELDAGRHNGTFRVHAKLPYPSGAGRD